MSNAERLPAEDMAVTDDREDIFEGYGERDSRTADVLPPISEWTERQHFVNALDLNMRGTVLAMFDCACRERDHYKLAAEMAQTSIIELQQDRDRLDQLVHQLGVCQTCLQRNQE